MKSKSMNMVAVWVMLALVVGGAGTYFLVKGGSSGELSTTAVVDPVTGDLVAPWANKLVNFKLITSDKFTGGDVDATLKVYAEKPEDWENPRGDFSDAVDYTAYTASSGEVTLNKEYPGTYYLVMTASGYNTEFMTITIPDGIGRGDIADYQANPDSAVAEFALLGATTDEDFAFTLTNATAKTVKDTILLTVDENTEFRGWKVIVNDEEGFSVDTDGDGVYDEGVSYYKVTVGSASKVIFEPSRGVDEFDSNDQYTMMLDDIVSDEGTLAIAVEIKANTGDYVGANDEVWGEGEGVLSYIKIYDAEGNLFETTDVTA